MLEAKLWLPSLGGPGVCTPCAVRTECLFPLDEIFNKMRHSEIVFHCFWRPKTKIFVTGKNPPQKNLWPHKPHRSQYHHVTYMFL